LAVYLVSYDLDQHAPSERYTRVEKLMRSAISCKKVLFSQWFIETNRSADWWSDAMKRTVDPKTDHWLISRVTGDRQGWLPASVWAWLDARIQRAAA
jgi:hypothetical protein